MYLRSQVNFFVTLFVERSGSTYLATLLDSHPQVLARREEFAQLRQRGAEGTAQLEWAKEFWKPPFLGRHKAIGFKTKLVDILDLPGFSRLLVDRRVRVIQLQRRNLVKAVISTMNAERLHQASGNWNLLKESDRLPPFEVDVPEFGRLLEERIQWDRDLEDYAWGLNLPRLSLYYEDLLRDEHAFLGQVLDFLGVKSKPVKGRTLKNTSDNLREVVLNFDDLRARYADTPFHEMFTEVIA
jgi:LPS sulfotransferase NodH